MASGDRFDMVIAIARGGFPPSRFICDFLNIEILSSVQINHYKSGGREEKIEVIDKIGRSIQNRNVLLIDDVNDTGDTLKLAHDYLSRLNPAILKSGVLHEKSNTSFTSDFKGKIQHEWEWLIYQWAAAEDVHEFLIKQGMQNADVNTARDFLAQEYNLSIDDRLMEQILQMKENYS